MFLTWKWGLYEVGSVWMEIRKNISSDSAFESENRAE
jgi:hypothetical protein